MNCHFCTIELPVRHIQGNHWDGEKYVRVSICDGCFGEKKLARHPRQPRKPRPQTNLLPATDWNYLVAFHNGRKKG